MLALTGAEALYADMGHFGKKPIRLAWFGFVLPALLLNYFGQGALLLRDPLAIASPFYLMVPRGAADPMIVLATAAAVIASQAVISGAFSMTREAIRWATRRAWRRAHLARDVRADLSCRGSTACCWCW